MLDVNSYHYTMMAKVFIPRLYASRSRHDSVFACVSSCSALRYMPSFLTYTATKAFADHLSEAVNIELAGRMKRVRLQTIMPGCVVTNICKDRRIEYVGTQPPKTVEAFLTQMANDEPKAFGTAWDEVFTKGSFGLCGWMFSPIFNFMTTWVASVMTR